MTDDECQHERSILHWDSQVFVLPLVVTPDAVAVTGVNNLMEYNT